VRQGVFEGKFALGEQPRFVEELGRLQVCQTAVQGRLGQLGNGLQQGQGYLGADDRGGLEHMFLLWRQPVNARCQYRLYRGRYLQAGEGLHQPIGIRRADEHPCLHQDAHALLQKERVAPGARDQEWLEWPQAKVVPQQRLQEFVRTRWRQWVEPELAVICLTAPAMLVLWPVVDQQQELGRR